MRKTTILGGLGAAAFVAASCVPPPGDARIDDPAYCGQTQDGKAVVALTNNSGICTRLPGQKLVLVHENCGPLMQGSNAVDDCWRGNMPGVGTDNFRLGSLQNTPGAQAINFVASDATAS